MGARAHTHTHYPFGPLGDQGGLLLQMLIATLKEHAKASFLNSCINLLGDEIQEPSWGQQKRQKPVLVS